jgi:hypothetical protein
VALSTGCAASAAAGAPGAATRRRFAAMGSLRAPPTFIAIPEWLTPFDVTAVKGI